MTALELSQLVIALTSIACYGRRMMRGTTPKTIRKQLNLLTWNPTLGVWTWNISPVKTCPGKTRRCKVDCFGIHGRCALQAPHYDRNTAATMRVDFLDLLVEDLRTILSAGYYRVRIHSTGDMYTPDYMRTILAAARLVPQVVLFSYSRTWRVAQRYTSHRPTAAGAYLGALREACGVLHPNVDLNASHDPATVADGEVSPEWMQTATYQDSWEGVNCEKQLDKQADCASCQRCYAKAVGYTAKQGPVVFHKH